METWNPERLEQNVLAATDETISLMVGLMTFGAATVEVGRHGVGSTFEVLPVAEVETEVAAPVAYQELSAWIAPTYPNSLGSIALGADGLVHAQASQFALAA